MPSLISKTHHKSIFIEGNVTLSNLYHRICYKFQCDLHDITLWYVGSDCKLSSNNLRAPQNIVFRANAKENEIILFVHLIDKNKTMNDLFYLINEEIKLKSEKMYFQCLFSWFENDTRVESRRID